MMHIAIDPGSTHMGKKEYIQELIETSKACGASSVKFQLFPNLSEFTYTGNIHMPFDLFEYAYNVGESAGIPVTASVFGEEELKFLLGFDVPYIKFAFAQRKMWRRMEMVHKKGIPVVVTTTLWDWYDFPVTKLITAYHDTKTLYPNPYLMDFSGLFPVRFQGYSDHSIGWSNAIRAHNAGSVWLEKHMMLDKPDIVCPDAKFALPITDLKTVDFQ